MKLWNHMMRVDHQIRANSWSARYLGEVSPTYDRVSGRRTLVAEIRNSTSTAPPWPRGARCSATPDSTPCAAGYTWEKNGFTAKEVQDGIPMTQLPVSLTMLTFLDGFANGAQFRINASYEVSDSYSWFVPADDGRSTTSNSAGSTYIRRLSCRIRRT